MRSITRCKIEGCISVGHKIKGIEYFTKGYCKKHYLRFFRYGDADFVKHIKGEHRMENPLYGVYLKMKERCFNPNATVYSYYGGRGITICERWLGVDGFANFIADMGERPIDKSLDRIDVNGNYEPDNVRWATRREQVRNTRRTKYLTAFGETRSLPDWCDLLGLNPKTVWTRLSRGWSDERALGMNS